MRESETALLKSSRTTAVAWSESCKRHLIVATHPRSVNWELSSVNIRKYFRSPFAAERTSLHCSMLESNVLVSYGAKNAGGLESGDRVFSESEVPTYQWRRRGRKHDTMSLRTCRMDLIVVDSTSTLTPCALVSRPKTSCKVSNS